MRRGYLEHAAAEALDSGRGEHSMGRARIHLARALRVQHLGRICDRACRTQVTVRLNQWSAVNWPPAYTSRAPSACSTLAAFMIVPAEGTGDSASNDNQRHWACLLCNGRLHAPTAFPLLEDLDHIRGLMRRASTQMTQLQSKKPKEEALKA